MKHLLIVRVGVVMLLMLAVFAGTALAAAPGPRTGPGGSGPGDATSAIPEGTVVTLEMIMDILGTIVRTVIFIAGILMVGSMIASGIMYVTAGDSGRVDTAKAWFWNSVKGSLIILGTGTILWTINALVSGKFFGYFW